jgi:hypothetical protein
MTDRTSKILQWFLYALLIISVVLGVLFYAGSGGADNMIYWAYVLLIFGVAITVLAAIINLFINPRGSVKFLILLGVMVIIAIVSYSVSTNEFNAFQLEEMEVTETTSRLVGAGLIFMYALAALAILSILFSTVSRIFK